MPLSDKAVAARPPAGGLLTGDRPRRPGKWGAGVAVSLLLHVAPLVIMGGMLAARHPAVIPDDVAFEVELVRLQAPPRPPSEKPPGPERTEAVAQSATPQPRIQPRMAAVADVEPLSAPLPEPQVESSVKSPPAPETTAPPSRPAPPAALAASAAQTWQGRLLAHLEQRKRYPAQARARRLQGVTYVRFTMDRQGRVLSASIDRSSGHSVLDAEALALLHRSQPLPLPPAEIPGDPISLSVPVDFFTRR